MDDFENPKSPQDENSLYRGAKERGLFSLNLLFLALVLSPSSSLSILLSFAHTFSLSPRRRRGCEDISAYRRLYRLSPLLQRLRNEKEREREGVTYTSPPFSSRFDVHPGQEYSWSSNFPSAGQEAQCIRMFLQLTRTLCILITARNALLKNRSTCGRQQSCENLSFILTLLCIKQFDI